MEAAGEATRARVPPTPANIAKAAITIPAGFRQVQGAPFGGPMTQFFG